MSSIAWGESDCWSAAGATGAGAAGRAAAGAAVAGVAAPCEPLSLVLAAGLAGAAVVAFAAGAGADKVGGTPGACGAGAAAARAGVDARSAARSGARSGVNSTTGAMVTGIGAAGSPGRADEARKRTASFCMMVRTCGLTIFSRTPSPTDLRSARIMATPTRSPCGARTGRKIPTRPSSRPFSWHASDLSFPSVSIASSTTLCSSGPNAPSLSQSTLACSS